MPKIEWNWKTITAAVVGVLVLGYVVTRAAGKAAAAVGDAVNPTSSTNVVNSGVTGLGRAITFDPDWSLGGQIYDWIHPDEAPNP